MPAEEDELQVNMVGRISIPEAKYGRVALADKIVFVGINFQSNFGFRYNLKWHSWVARKLH